MASIGYFSIIALIFTVMSFLLIAYECIQIISLRQGNIFEQDPVLIPSNQTMNEHPGQVVPPKQKYVYWNLAMLPAFSATMMNLFEGNQQILNLYAEADQPRTFFSIIVFIFLCFLLILAIVLGLLGYLAFGNEVQSVILFNLPPKDPFSIAAKLFYIITIAGSFAIVTLPVFHVVERWPIYQNLFKDKKKD